MRVGQGAGQQLMAGVPHAAQIDLCLGNLARQLLDLHVGARAGDLPRKRFHLL